MSNKGKNSVDGGWRQTLKVIAVFILAVLALMAMQLATRVHQSPWQILDRR